VLTRPRYREGYFRFDILKAGKAWRAGRTVCLFTDEFGRGVGAGFLSRFDDQQVWFESRLSADYIPEWSGRLAAKVTPSPNQAFQRRLALLCPACRERRDSLWYTGEWACWRCLRLHLRRQLVDEETLKWERKAELEALIGNGRPHWWRQSRYQALRNELDQLEEELRWREERVASVQHARVIHAEWYRAAEVEDRFTAFAIPSEERQRRPEGWLEGFELRRASESQAQPNSAPPAPAAPKIPGLRFNPSDDGAPNGDDPDEVSIEDM
jgi:hypothetical protein